MTSASQTWPKSSEGAGIGFWWLSRCGGEKGISRERPGGSGLEGKLGSGCSGGTMLDSAKSPGQLIPQLQGEVRLANNYNGCSGMIRRPAGVGTV